jgi:FAD/FMN-containing dehydrogenase
VPQYLARPRDEAELQRVVQEARRLELPIRASGAGHSNPAMVPTPGIHVDCSRMQEVISVDKASLQVTVQPGMILGDLSRYLRTQGMSLNNQGDIDTQTVAGALMTATHGAGIRLPCMSAQLVAARIVLADASVLEISAAADGELFKAFRTSLGMFGLIASLTLQAVPSYNILKSSWNADVEDCISNLQRTLAANRTFWFFWLPRAESADLFELPAGVPARNTRDYDICHMRSYNAAPVAAPPPELAPGEVFDHSSVIYPNSYVPNWREIEYAVPFAKFEEAFAEIRSMFQRDYPDNLFPVECRPVFADDTYLSAYSERDGYALCVSGPIEHATWALLRDADAIFQRYDGRPHWGKHHFMTQARLERLYPRYDAFKTLRRQLDPTGVFLNDHLRALFA